MSGRQNIECSSPCSAQIVPGDAARAEQAKTLVALGKSDPKWQALLDREVIEADVSLHASGKYEQVGVDVGNGWQRQNNGGLMVWPCAGGGRLHSSPRLSQSDLPHSRHRLEKCAT